MNKSVSVKILWLAAALFLAGCATHRVDWNARIGSFTYDQAVVELGPPDKQAKLTDGQTVAEWISRSSSGGTVMVGGGFYTGPAGVSLMQTGPSYYESKLRLTFTTNNVLAAWKKK
ncbi:MAG TPA: hypothetical protein VF492_08655 [Verrucomicrobiae bacterium]|jgi:hypothetical protein